MKPSKLIIAFAIGVALAPYTSLPVGIAKINPTQHFVNVVGAVILGPWWAALIAAIIGIIRNSMGVGTLLAFPGGMIGALLAGLFYMGTGKLWFAAAGEIIGTGILASLVAVPYAKFLMGTESAAFFFMPPFLVSSATGAVLGVLLVYKLKSIYVKSELY